MKSNSRKVFAALLGGSVLAMSLAGGAFAFGSHGMARGPQDGGVMAMSFAEIDADGNGLITEEDLLARAEARFAEADTNGDGFLDGEEMLAQAEARMAERQAEMGERARPGRLFSPEERVAKRIEQMLETRDADGDGMLSFAETAPAQGFGRMIDRFDTDDDNAVSEAEFDAAKEEIAAHAGRGPGGHGGPGMFRGHR